MSSQEPRGVWMSRHTFIPTFSLSRIWLLALALGLLLPLGRAWGQGGLATVNGTVYDVTHRVVPNAQVLLTNQQSGEIRQSKTNSAGVFNFPAVPQGLYSVTVTKQGFAALTKTDIAVNASETIKVTDLNLKPGSVTQTVSVKGNAYYAIPLSSGAKQNVLTSQQIQNTLVETRDAVELLKILPGVVNFGYNPAQASGYGSGVGNNTFTINGTRGDTIQESFDGADNIDPGNYGGNAAMPDVDMISQVTVQTSNFSASNPKGPTVISTVTKAGGSAYHGELYYSTRLSQFNANDWQSNQNGVARPASKFYYPGGNIGGPVIIPGTSFNKHHDKMFFWAGFEYMKQNQDTGFFDTVVPTPAMRAGNFTNDPWAGMQNGVYTGYPKSWNVAPGTFWSQSQAACDPAGASFTNANGLPNYGTAAPSCLSPFVMNPAAFDKNGVALMSMVPQPNANPAQHFGNNFVSQVLAPTNHKTFRARVDYDFSPNTKLYVVGDRDSEFEYMPYGLWWHSSDVPYPGQQDAFDHSYQLSGTFLSTISPTLTNSVQVGSTRIVFNNGLADPSKASLTGVGYTYNGLYKNTTGYVPSFMSWGGGFPTMDTMSGAPGPNDYAWKWLNDVRDDLSKVMGNHVVKLGVYYEHTTNTQPVGDPRGTAQLGWGGCNACSWDQYDVNNVVGDLLIGTIGSGGWSQTNVALTGLTYDNELDFYGQDSWKATPQLTLNYGLRVYYSPFMEESGGRESVFNLQAYKGPSCLNPGIMGCGSGPLQNPVGGGNAPLSSFSGLQSHQTNPSVSMGGFPAPGLQYAPNVGFAYDLTGKGNTVIRGGFGMYYYRDEGNFFFNSIENPPYLLNSSPGNVYTLAQANNPANIPGVGKVGLSVLDPYNNKIPMTESWSLTWSQRLGFHTVMEASYVGNSSFHQDTPGGTGNGGLDFNYVPWGSELQYEQVCNAPNAPAEYNCGGHNDDWWRPYQNYSTITWYTHSLDQNYNGFQLSFTRTTGRLSYAANYTFSKALGESGVFNSNGNVVDPFDARGRSYGPLPYDRSQVLNLTYSFILPSFGKRWFGGNPVAEGFLDGWQFSGISSFSSGAPFNFGSGQNGQSHGFSQIGCPSNGVMPSGYRCTPSPAGYSVNFNGDTINGTPDSTVNMFVVCDPRANLKPNQFFNANCFKSPSPGNNGEYQFPYIHGPSFMSNDLGVFKNFALGKSESQKIQVRIEGFNFLNHANWTPTNTGLQFTGYNQHAYSIAPEYTGGQGPGFLTEKSGNRIMEFEVKYIF